MKITKIKTENYVGEETGDFRQTVTFEGNVAEYRRWIKMLEQAIKSKELAIDDSGLNLLKIDGEEFVVDIDEVRTLLSAMHSAVLAAM